MRKFKFITAFIILTIFVSCKEEKSFSISQPSMPLSELKVLALKKGDTSAYHSLSRAYMDSPNDTSFITTAKAMASNYKFHLAYLDVYYYTIDYYHRADYLNLDDLSKESQSQAVKALIESSELGNREAKKLLGNYYLQGKYIDENKEKGRKLLKESE